MAIVKNKNKLCETSLSDFSIEQVNGIPFYGRYQEIERIFRKHIPLVNFNKCFAQPYENKAKKVIEWYYEPSVETPFRLSDIKQSDASLHANATRMADTIVNNIKKAAGNTGDEERRYLNAVLSGLGSPESDSTIYLVDGHILFGVWGMKTKPGRKLEDVIREDVLDHRVFTINYTVQGMGSLSFSSIGRKYGHRISSADVPQVTPSQGWKFTSWLPDVPQGTQVTNDMTFTALCEEDNSNGEEDIEKNTTDKIENKDEPRDEPLDNNPQNDDLEPDEPEKYTILFRSDEGGFLAETTVYLKKEGEKVLANEVPAVKTNEGYEFIGWDKTPEGYEVHSDIVFTARFRKMTENVAVVDSDKGHWWHGGGFMGSLLNWLLLALGLLLLFLLLWCFIFGKCHFNMCGCDCPDTTKVTPGPPAPLQKPCDTEEAYGGYQGYTGYFDMGQQSGIFNLDYNTLNAPDRITVYEGKGTSGTVIFKYEGGTETWLTEPIEFHNQIVTINVEGLEPSTVWYMRVNCPNQ